MGEGGSEIEKERGSEGVWETEGGKEREGESDRDGE